MLPSCRSESRGQLGEASFLPGSFTVLAAALVVPGTGLELDTEVHGREAVAPVSDVFQSRLLSWPWQASEKLHAEHLPWELENWTPYGVGVARLVREIFTVVTFKYVP